MAKPSHPVLASEHSVDLRTVKAGDQEVYQVTFQFLVKSGTNIEQLLADIVTGHAPSLSPNAVKGSVVDVTKVA